MCSYVSVHLSAPTCWLPRFWRPHNSQPHWHGSTRSRLCKELPRISHELVSGRWWRGEVDVLAMYDWECQRLEMKGREGAMGVFGQLWICYVCEYVNEAVGWVTFTFDCSVSQHPLECVYNEKGQIQTPQIDKNTIDRKMLWCETN